MCGKCRSPTAPINPSAPEIKQYFLAIHSDNEEEVKKFLAPPYNVNITRLFTANLDGATFKWTALQAAAFYGAVKVIRVLMAAGSNVEQQDEWYGGRALAWACFGNRAEAAKVLIEEFGADKTAANNGGQLPWDLVADKLDGKWKGVILSEEDWTAQRNEIIRKAEAGDMAALAAHLPLMTHNTKSKTLYAEGWRELDSTAFNLRIPDLSFSPQNT